mgnify:CR=1 FL=1
MIIVPADIELSIYQWNKEEGKKSAYVYKSDDFDIVKTVYDVSGNPPLPSGFPEGPDSWANRYSTRRKFFPVAENTFVWQCLTSKAGKLTVLGGQTIDLEVDQGFILGAATNGNAGEFYYVTIEDGQNEDKVTTRQAYMIHAKLDGSIILKKSLDTSKEGLNIWNFSESCMLVFGGDAVRIHVTRKMSKSNDGLNH